MVGRLFGRTLRRTVFASAFAIASLSALGLMPSQASAVTCSGSPHCYGVTRWLPAAQNNGAIINLRHDGLTYEQPML